MSETPILDLQRDPPKLRRPWLSVLFGVLIGLALLRWASIDPLWWFPVLYGSIAFHEIGHLVAARLVGMKAGGIAVGGLLIFKSGDRWIWRFDFRRILSGGLAKPLSNKGGFTRAQHAWMVAGGPLATLFLAAVSGIALRNSGNSSGWLSSLWWINVLLFFSTMIPTSGLNKSDFPRLWQLLRDPAGSQSWLAVLEVQSEEAVGVMPRDWDAESVALMLQHSSKAGDNAYRQMLAFYRRIDEGAEAAALQHLERALAAAGSGDRSIMHWCFLEAASCSAILRGNSAAGRTWLERATKLRKPLSKHSIDAAIAQSEQRYEDAIASYDASLAYIVRKKLDSGLIRFAKVKIAEYQNQCRVALRDRAAATVAAESDALPSA